MWYFTTSMSLWQSFKITPICTASWYSTTIQCLECWILPMNYMYTNQLLIHSFIRSQASASFFRLPAFLHSIEKAGGGLERDEVLETFPAGYTAQKNNALISKDFKNGSQRLLRLDLTLVVYVLVLLNGEARTDSLTFSDVEGLLPLGRGLLARKAWSSVPLARCFTMSNGFLFSFLSVVLAQIRSWRGWRWRKVGGGGKEE